METIDKNDMQDRISFLTRALGNDIRTRELLAKRLSPRDVDVVMAKLSENLNKLMV